MSFSSSAHRPSPAKLVGTASYIPVGRDDNLAAALALGISEESLRAKIGVSERAKKQDNETLEDMCVSAFHALSQKHQIALSGIDIVCVVTQNPDQTIPHSSARIHERLKLPNSCMTFDISQGCAGFVHGAVVISALMERLSLSNALLFTCDPYSKIIDPNDRNTALIFGDAATVTLFGSEGPGYYVANAEFGTAAGTADCLNCDRHLAMDGRAIVMNAMREVPKSIDAILKKSNFSQNDVELFLLHPGSKFVVESLREKMGLDPVKAPFMIEGYGNTVSSSIPIMLESFMQRPVLEHVVISGFGVGFSWGTALLIHSCNAEES